MLKEFGKIYCPLIIELMSELALKVYTVGAVNTAVILEPTATPTPDINVPNGRVKVIGAIVIVVPDPPDPLLIDCI